MSWSQLARNRSVVAAVAVLLAVAVIWGVALVAAARPRTLDERVHDVATQLLCPACQGGVSVADAPSSIAANMRAVIRAKLQHGESEQQVIQDLVSSYGEGIRETPPLSGFTLLIWLGPVAMLLAGAFVVGSVARQWQEGAPQTEVVDPELADVSDTELARYRALLAADLDGSEAR